MWETKVHLVSDFLSLLAFFWGGEGITFFTPSFLWVFALFNSFLFISFSWIFLSFCFCFFFNTGTSMDLAHGVTILSCLGRAPAGTYNNVTGTLADPWPPSGYCGCRVASGLARRGLPPMNLGSEHVLLDLRGQNLSVQVCIWSWWGCVGHRFTWWWGLCCWGAVASSWNTGTFETRSWRHSPQHDGHETTCSCIWFLCGGFTHLRYKLADCTWLHPEAVPQTCIGISSG